MIARLIESTWTTENGRWSEQLNDYEDRTATTRTKLLVMQVFRGGDGKLRINFEGGPTGYERYYVDTLLKDEKFGRREDDDFPICFGTVNLWPTVTVSAKAVRAFLEEAINETE